MAGQTRSHQYNTAAVRALIRDAFTDRELWRFCQDSPAFQPVTDFFDLNTSLEGMIDVLIKYCDVRGLFPRLLREIRIYNPRQYLRYREQLAISAAPLKDRETWRDSMLRRLENTITIVRQPAKWQEVTWNFLSEHRFFLPVTVVLEVLLAAIYLRFHNLYLLPWWLWGLAAVLLLFAAWCWYTWIWRARTWIRLVVALLFSASFVGLVGWQAWQAAFPEQFAPQTFGIAVAELGEGAGFRRTDKAREISDQVYEYLCRTLKQDSAVGTEDPCEPAAEALEHRHVELRRIGVIPDSQTAQAYGSRLEADVVIWGQILTAEEGKTSIRFQVLETPDRDVNPEFPIVLPVKTASAELFATELDLESDPVTLKRVIARQSTVIASFTLGLVAYLDRDFPQAVNQFEAAKDAMESNSSLEITPDGSSLLYFYLGRANYAMGRIEEGEKWHRQAQATDPEEPAIPLSIGLGQRSLGQVQESEASLDRALAMIQRWLETHPDDTTALYNRGVIHLVRAQYEDAVLDYEKVIELDPGFYIAYIGLGQAASQMGRFEQATDALQTAISQADERGANSAWAHLNLALIYQGAGEPASAEAEFLAAIELKPETPWMYYYYARFLEGRQEMDAALLAYRTMADVAQNKGWAYGHLGDFYRRRGLLQEALESYKRAVHEQPEDALHRAHLAQTYFVLGDVDKAIPAFEQSIKDAPESYYVYASYGWALLQLEDWERAATMYERSLQLRPDEYTSLLNLGQIYESQGQHDKAKVLYAQIVGSDAFSEEQIQVARDRLQVLAGEAP